MGLWGIRRENTMWRDESVTYQVARRSLSEIWHLLGNADAVHGLYYFLMHALFAVGGDSLVTLRLPSVLATSVSAFLVAATGNRLVGPRTGLIGGLAFALLPMVQMYAQEGRSYAMVCALIALSTYLLVGAVDNSSRRRWTAYALTVVAAGWLHEFAVLALPAHGLTLYLSRLPRAPMRSWAVAAGLSVVAVAPSLCGPRASRGRSPGSGGRIRANGSSSRPSPSSACSAPGTRRSRRNRPRVRGLGRACSVWSGWPCRC